MTTAILTNESVENIVRLVMAPLEEVVAELKTNVAELQKELEKLKLRVEDAAETEF